MCSLMQCNLETACNIGWLFHVLISMHTKRCFQTPARPLRHDGIAVAIKTVSFTGTAVLLLTATILGPRRVLVIPSSDLYPFYPFRVNGRCGPHHPERRYMNTSCLMKDWQIELREPNQKLVQSIWCASLYLMFHWTFILVVNLGTLPYFHGTQNVLILSLSHDWKLFIIPFWKLLESGRFWKESLLLFVIWALSNPTGPCLPP